ncbi:nucleotidyltransferase domain-containing protein [Candidatus Pacearchaeota archaeon]|nr:nucleotidyltransferase domain-containing protein [Candidatus Pacearchaeota archaeon]
METLVKQTREVGTSAGVLLPRKWLNKQVVVTLLSPSKESIAKDVLEILFKQNLNEEIKGIYIVGSYARNDYDPNSDVDVLVITKKVNKLINQGNYEILLVSEDNFSKNLPMSLNYLSMLKEIKVIINKELIEKYATKKYKLNTKGILKEIEKILRINKESVGLCEENKKNVPDGIVYSIVLRLRELCLIKCLLSNINYYKKEFTKICGEKAYSAYLRVKRNEKELNNNSPNEIKNLLDLSEKWLKELKG